MINRAILTRIFLFLIVLVPSAAAQTLQGAGSTSPFELYSKWFETYRKSHSGIKIHYRPTGSSVGIDELNSGRVDFAASEVPVTDEQLKAAKAKFGSDILEVPSVVEAVVPIYKVDGVSSELKFTGAALAGIYLGKITRWDDPQIADINRTVRLPNTKIIVVHRSDISDSTYLWTDYLSRVSPEWKAGPGTGLTVKWPIGIGAKGDDGVEDLVVGPVNNYGVTELVNSIDNSIGYVQLHYAIENQLPYGDVESNNGGFVRASQSSLMAAAMHAASDNLRSSIEYEPGEGTYPISSFTWFLVPAKMQDQSKVKAMADFLKWMLTDGQNSVEALHYVKLPQPVVDKALQELSQIP